MSKLKEADLSALKRFDDFQKALKEVRPHPEMMKSLEYAHEQLKSGNDSLLVKAFKEDSCVGQKARLAEKVSRRLLKLKKGDDEFKKMAKEAFPWSSYFSGEINK